MDTEYLRDIEAVNTQIAKQKKQLERINAIHNVRSAQYLQQARHMQVILNEQELMNYQAGKAQVTIQKTAGALGGLKTVTTSLGKAIVNAFTAVNIGGYLMEAVKGADSLQKQFLVLRLSLGKLKSAIGEAVAPIVASFLPTIQNAVYAAIRWAKNLGLVIRALFGGAQGSEEMAQAQEKLAVSTGKASRALASFDQIERLNGGSGGGGGSTTSATFKPVNDALTPQLQAIVDTIRGVMAKIQSLIAPLKDIDFTPAAEAFRRLGSAVADFGAQVLSALESAWHTLLVPLSKWVIEEAVPASVNALTAAFSALRAIFAPLQAGFSSLRTALTPFAQFLGETVKLTLQALQAQFEKLGQAFLEHTPALTGSFQTLASALTALWERAKPVLEQLRSFFLQVIGSVGDAAASLPQILSGITDFLSGVFSGSWRSAWEGLKTVLKGVVNSIISLLNTLLRGLVSGINGVAAALNGLSVKVPNWVPVLGGKTYGFSIPAITAPQIPYLAQGAVLPAGKPFLAMVGDQHHGTNIEAPLSTIQEAVALVMQDQTDALTAGFNASLEVQREILSAVLGIQIGDEVIAAAYDRCQSRRAVMKGASYAF